MDFLHLFCLEQGEWLELEICTGMCPLNTISSQMHGAVEAARCVAVKKMVIFLNYFFFFLCPAISLWRSSVLVMAKNINANGRDWADNQLCSVGGSLAAALWMCCAGLSDLRTTIRRAWRQKHSPGRSARFCSWCQGKAQLLCSPQLLLPAPLASSFTT